MKLFITHVAREFSLITRSEKLRVNRVVLFETSTRADRRVKYFT